MKVTIRHPALVRAKTKGGRVARLSVILPEAEFTVHDLDHRQAPVAFVVSRSTYGEPPIVREVRAFNDGLYLAVKKEPYSQLECPQNLDDLVAGISSGSLDRKGFLLPIIEKVRSGTRGAGEEAIMPSGIYNGLNYSTLPDGHDLVNAAIKLADQIVIDDVVRDDIAAWHDSMQRYIDTFISVDGQVYKRCGEPIYVLQQSGYSISSLDVHFLESEFGRGPSTLLTFSASSVEQATSALELAKSRDKEGDHTHSSNPQVVIEVVNDTHVRWRAEEQDFDRFARSFENTLNSGIDDLRKRKDIHVPRYVYDAWLDLRDCLSTFDKLSGNIPEELEAVLANAIAVWRRYEGRIDDEICKHPAPSIGVVDTMFQRFSDRQIDMAHVVGYGGPSFKS
jgi:hypothetical protein